LQKKFKKKWKSPAFLSRNSLQLKNSFFRLLLTSDGTQPAAKRGLVATSLFCSSSLRGYQTPAKT